jgi:2OG-Fe(II) oxygenase superfamily
VVKIFIEDSFVDKNTCAELITYLSDASWFVFDDEFWSGRIYRFGLVEEPILSVANQIKTRIADYIESKFHSPAHCDTIDFVRWQDGREMPPHRDAMKMLMYRDWGSVLYLNDNYEGGHTYYPELNMDVKPRAGSLVVHEGNVLHGVRPVSGNTRYTIASFWTKDKEKAVYDQLY